MTVEKQIEELLPLNCSTIFLPYPLGLDVPTLKEKYGFIGCYLSDINKEVFVENPVFFLFKPKDIIRFEDEFLRNEYDRTSATIEDYDYGEHVVVVYRFPPQFSEDFDKFLEGKYSKFSRDFKATFPKVKRVGNLKEESTQWKIMTKSKELKSMLEEYFDTKFEEEDELWKVPGKEQLNIQL